MNIETIYAELAPKLTKYLMGNGLSYATTCDMAQEMNLSESNVKVRFLSR